MKQFNRIILILMLLPLFSITAAQSDNANKKSLKVEMKCHVELLGGKDKIIFTKVKRSQMNDNALLKGHKKNIYRLIECVELNESFSSNKSKSVDTATAR